MVQSHSSCAGIPLRLARRSQSAGTKYKVSNASLSRGDISLFAIIVVVVFRSISATRLRQSCKNPLLCFLCVLLHHVVQSDLLASHDGPKPSFLNFSGQFKIGPACVIACDVDPRVLFIP